MLRPGERLPSDRALAAKFGISDRTVGKILKRYEARGRLCRIRGKGTFVPGGNPPEAHQEPATSADAVAQTLYSSICRAELKTGEALPSIKFMCLKFKITPATVRDAYRKLEADGHVTRVGRTFWVGSFDECVRPDPGKEVFLFNCRSDDFTCVFVTDNLSLAYQKMVKELLSRGFVVRHENTDRLSALIAGWMRSARVPYGLVFHRINEDAFEKLAPSLQRLFAWAKPLGLPPVLVDWHRGRMRMQSPNIVLLSRGSISTVVAKAMARRFAERRCREVVFVMDRGVDHFLWSPTGFLKFRAEAKKLQYHFRFHLVVETSNLRRDKAEILAELQQANALEVIGKYEPTPFSEVEKEIVFTPNALTALDRMTGAGAWVFARDEKAAEAMRRRGKRDVWIAGLDNDPRFFHKGLSYAGPDWEEVGYLMAHAIIRDFPIARTSGGFIRTRASVVER